jgi:hypothetical protein
LRVELLALGYGQLVTRPEKSNTGHILFTVRQRCRLSLGQPAWAQDEGSMRAGGSLTSRLLLTGFEARFGVRDLLQGGTDARFDGSYLPLMLFDRTAKLSFELGANALVWTSEPPLGAAQLSLVGYAGAGPLLARLDQPHFAIGIGGLIGLETRYAGLGLFLDLDTSILFLGAGATGVTFAPVPIPKVTAGVNYYF